MHWYHLPAYFFAGALLANFVPHFVSGVLEREADLPLVGMQRYFSGKEPYTASGFPHIRSVTSYLDRRKRSRIWARSGDGDGVSCDSGHHGDFDNDPQTLASMQHMLLKGY